MLGKIEGFCYGSFLFGRGRLLLSYTPLFGYNTLGFPLGTSTTQGNAVSMHGNQLS